MKYEYPQVQGGYRWNMLQRCLNEVGRKQQYNYELPTMSYQLGGY